MLRNLEMMIISWILKSPNTLFQTENPITYKFLRLSNPQRQQFIMPCHAVAKHHHKIQSVKSEMEDSLLDNNRLSCLMQERKNGIMTSFLKKPVELMKATKKEQRSQLEACGDYKSLVNPAVIIDEILFRRLFLQQLSTVEYRQHMCHVSISYALIHRCWWGQVFARNLQPLGTFMVLLV